MPINQCHSFEKCWPSQDLNLGPSTFAADALTPELLDWADWLMSNLRWHDGSRPYDLQLPPSHYWLVTPSFTRTCMASVGEWTNVKKISSVLQRSPTILQWQESAQGICTGINYCRARQSHTILWHCALSQDATRQSTHATLLKSVDPAGTWTQDLPLLGRGNKLVLQVIFLSNCLLFSNHSKYLVCQSISWLTSLLKLG